MKVIIAHSVKKKEFKNGKIPERDLQTILKSFGKGILVALKGSSLPAGSRLAKVYATTAKGARRIVFLIDVASGDGFFLFYRDKKDKIGQNMSIQNPLFRDVLHKYLRLLMSDIENGRYQQHKLD